jgi:hypothetical protein
MSSDNMKNAGILEKFQPLQFRHEIADPNIESFGDSSQCFNCDFIFSPLDVSDVIPRQVRFFRQLFLAQTSLDPLGTDGFAKSSGYFAASRHGLTAKQEYELQIYQAYLVNNLLFRFDTDNRIHNPSDIGNKL